MYKVEIQFWNYDILEHSKSWVFYKEENAQKVYNGLLKKHPEANEILNNTYTPIVLYMSKLKSDDDKIDNILASL